MNWLSVPLSQSMTMIGLTRDWHKLTKCSKLNLFCVKVRRMNSLTKSSTNIAFDKHNQVVPEIRNWKWKLTNE